jgi:hypothetical protein
MVDLIHAHKEADRIKCQARIDAEYPEPEYRAKFITACPDTVYIEASYDDGISWDIVDQYDKHDSELINDKYPSLDFGGYVNKREDKRADWDLGHQIRNTYAH